jgi:hypothetical protein
VKSGQRFNNRLEANAHKARTAQSERSTAPRGRSLDRDIEERDAPAVIQSYFHQLAACGPAVWCSSTADAACMDASLSGWKAMEVGSGS